jgi:hypothetical protein
MPQLDLPDILKKEIDVGGRKIPVLVPIAGAVIAVALLVTSRLRSGAASPAQPAQGEPAPASATGQAPHDQGDTFMSALAGFQKQVETAQGDIASQVASFQGSVGTLQAGQASLAGQITGFQSQLGEQAQAFQAGIAGVQSQATGFQSDVNTRISAVEAQVQRVNQELVAQRNAGPSQEVKRILADSLGLIVTYGINPHNARAGFPQWQTSFNAQTGEFQWNPGGGWSKVF